MPETPPLFDTATGRRITSVQVQQAMRINVAAGCLGMLWFAMSLNMPLTMFMEAVGAGGFLIGLLTAVRQCVMAVQVPSAFISEHLGSRKQFWAGTALVHRALWFVIAGIVLCWKPDSWWIPVGVVSLVGLSDLIGNMGSAAWNSWMADLIPAKNAGRFWGRRQSIVTAASLLGMAIAGFALDQFRMPGSNKTSAFGFALVFAIAAVCGVGDVLVHLWVKEPRPAPAEVKARPLKRLLAPLRNHDFRHLTFAMGIWSFGCSMLGPFSIVYLKRYFPVTYTHVAVITIAGSLGSVATSFILGSLTDRLGPRVLCAILMILAPLTAVPWFFVDASFLTFHLPILGLWSIPKVVVIIGIFTFLGGSVFSGVSPCQLRLAALLSNSSGRTMAMAVHWAIIGIIAALGSLAGGWFMDYFNAHPPLCLLTNGTAFSFLHAIIIAFALLTWGIAMPLVLSIRAAVDHVGFGEAVSRMFLINPLNAVRNFYTLQIITTASTARVRAQAARSLGVHKSGLAVPDLIEQLDDPVTEVQEEAIDALGMIGTEEALDALLRKLDDPACDLIPQICRTLRDCGDARCVAPLLRQLQTTDREILSESARTLGRIGDRRAIPHLLDLITHSHDSKVLAASSEALAALGELSAAYQIIPQMRAVSNRMLKRALAIAAGDLLGKREAFYQLLLADTEDPGAGASQVIRDLTRVVKKEFPLATRQVETLEMLESAYHDRDPARCAELLLHLGLHMVQFMHRLPITLDPNEAMNRLLECDRRAAIGVWYLKILSEPWGKGADSRDHIDILLGLHVVLSFTDLESAEFQQAHRGPP
ncbi:MAG: MFS transporter [Verrucomicrobiota bacterium]